MFALRMVSCVELEDLINCQVRSESFLVGATFQVQLAILGFRRCQSLAYIRVVPGLKIYCSSRRAEVVQVVIEN